MNVYRLFAWLRVSKPSLLLSGLISILAALVAPVMSFSYAYADSAQSSADSADCSSMMVWPINDPRIVQDYDAPEHNWLPGHRGIDLVASEGTVIKAPDNGVIVFTGKVAGKDVVSVEHPQGWRSTFEPATTTLRVGARITRGEDFATRSVGKSEHCDQVCVHWGIKISANSYVNPQKLTKLKRITIQRPQD